MGAFFVLKGIVMVKKAKQLSTAKDETTTKKTYAGLAQLEKSSTEIEELVWWGLTRGQSKTPHNSLPVRSTIRFVR